jgi:hypothetical protein
MPPQKNLYPTRRLDGSSGWQAMVINLPLNSIGPFLNAFAGLSQVAGFGQPRHHRLAAADQTEQFIGFEDVRVPDTFDASKRSCLPYGVNFFINAALGLQ